MLLVSSSTDGGTASPEESDGDVIDPEDIYLSLTEEDEYWAEDCQYQIVADYFAQRHREFIDGSQ